MATWIPSDTANIHLVDTDKDLDGAQDDISRASIIAIDCEWSPTASQHGKAQRALLIQLAMRIPGRCDTCHVLDMIALPRRRVSNILTSAFRRENVLKLGFQIPTDLKAIAAALNTATPLDQGPCAVVRPCVDIGVLSKFLRFRGVAGAQTPVSGGLSALVEAQLGRALDKSLQCSAWEKRPLTAAQVRYAAADALVLLSLFDSLLSACHGAPLTLSLFPARLGFPEPPSATAPPSGLSDSLGGSFHGGGGEKRGCVTGAGDGSGTDLRTEGLAEGKVEGREWGAETSAKGDKLEGGDGSGSGKAEGGARGREGEGMDCSGSGKAEGGAGGRRSCHDGAWWTRVDRDSVEGGASVAWGFEVRVSGDDLKVSVSEGAGHAPGRPSGRRKGGRGGREGACWGFDLKRELFGGGRPQKQDEEVELAVEVPWEGTRGGGGPRFVVDSMLEGLARLLRLYGVDAAGLPADVKDCPSRERWRVHRALVEAAEGEGRVVLTKDRIFIRKRHTERAYLVKEGKKEAQMQEVAIRFKVHLSPSNIMSRCSLCNGEFERSRLRAEDLQEGHEVPEGVMATRDVFWRCADCQQVYWEGCKFQNALERLSGRIDALGIGGS